MTSLPRCRASCVARFNFEFRIRLNRTIIHASSSAPDHETAKDSADSADTPSFIYKPPLSRESTDVRSSQPDFTRNFGGAVATIILGASLLAERLNGYAIVESLELRGFHPLLVITIVWLVIASIWPGKKRVDGEQQEDIVTKIQNFAPRIVYITLAVSIAAEMITEKVRPSCIQSALHSLQTNVHHPNQCRASLLFSI